MCLLTPGIRAGLLTLGSKGTWEEVVCHLRARASMGHTHFAFHRECSLVCLLEAENLHEVETSHQSRWPPAHPPADQTHE